MTNTLPKPASVHPLEPFIDRLLSADALLPDSETNVLEVVGILKSYGVVLDAYSKNLIYIADHQFLVLFPFFKYFNGEVSFGKLLKHWWHDRINFEYAEYCMKAMLWHGGGKMDEFLDSQAFLDLCRQATTAKTKANPLVRSINAVFPDFLTEQVRQLAYYSALGQFWRVMSDLFIDLSDAYDAGTVKTIPEVVAFIKAGLVAAASNPITYNVEINGQTYDLLPKSAGLTFLMDVAVPYVEAVFFRGAPFLGTVSYNAQADQIPAEQSRFQYGALYADPIPVGGAGIPPTLLMQDMRHFLPDYLTEFYLAHGRGLDDVRVKICQSFQKSMFCVTSASLQGLLPHAADTTDPQEQVNNRTFLAAWMDRLITSRLDVVQL
ncbi:CO2 hydration protein [Phormidium sp. FACHB-1136]|jgi:CO2 hydration protein|uniref:CO2 hydration protein n=1 Tax=Phormidium sp. FACHB-1136 TaxID=2692848 RepID=UPI0016865C27|nr:CO2 hydration protein [Phormidium sp. FACHB-1136]MBD2427233.1 CO2 hydration protein [Phormidium sp. FACHB-1136]